MKVILALLAAALTAQAATSDPGQAALAFLEKVRTGKLNLEPGGDTAVSAHTLAHKRQQIARRIERMAADLGSDPLEVGAIKLDENFAAVLVRKVGGFDPKRLQVFPIALVKREGGWSVAPVPASFENTGETYASELRSRLGRLESWMLEGQVSDLETLRAQSLQRMREKIRAAVDEKSLMNLNAEQIGEKFMAACAARDVPAMLYFFGGMVDPLPADWSNRLRAADHVSKGELPANDPWRLFTSNEILRVLVHHEEDAEGGLISVACLDPQGSARTPKAPAIEVIHFDLIKKPNNTWQINPNAKLLLETATKTRDEPDFDSDLADLFPEKWQAKNPPQPQDTLELLQEKFIASLRESSPRALLSYTVFNQPPKQAKKTFLKACNVWWKIHQPTAVIHAMPLSFQSNAERAVGIYQFFSAREPGRFDPQVFHFEKSAEGWLWNPEPGKESRDAYQEWVNQETAVAKNNWQQKLIADSTVLQIDAETQPPSEDAAIKLVDAWHAAATEGDLNTGLKLTARLDDPKSVSLLLQNFGYEVLSARRDGKPIARVRVYQGKSLTGVGMKREQDGKITYPFYAVITTPQGPRIIPEIDLFAGGNRGRDFLNKSALDRLQSQAPTAHEDLKELLNQYQTLIQSQLTDEKKVKDQ